MNLILKEHLVLISCDRSMTSFLATPTSAPADEENYAVANIGKVGAVLRRARVYTVVAAKPSLSTN